MSVALGLDSLSTARFLRTIATLCQWPRKPWNDNSCEPWHVNMLRRQRDHVKANCVWRPPNCLVVKRIDDLGLPVDGIELGVRRNYRLSFILFS